MKFSLPRISVLLFCLLTYFTIKAQEEFELPPKFVISGKFLVEEGSPEGGLVNLMQYNDIVDSKVLTKSGKFKFKLDFDSDYELVFTKIGYVKKRIEVITHVPKEIFEANSEFPEFEFEVHTFKKYEGVDVEIFTIQTAGDLAYNKDIDNFEFTDYHLDDNIKAEIQKLKEKATEEENSYNKAISKADDAFAKKKYKAAEIAYKEALAIKPNSEYPTKQLIELDKISQIEAKKKAEQEVIEYKYTSAINWANDAFKAEKYSEAEVGYNQALAIKPNDKYAKDQLREVKKRIAGKAEQARVEKLEAYREKIDEAKIALQHNEYDKAKQLFAEAQSIKPEEKYPAQMLEKIDGMKADYQKDLAAEQKKQNWVDKTTAKADAAFNDKDYDTAKKLYESVLKFQKKVRFNQSNQYPKQQLMKIADIEAERQNKLEAENKIKKNYTKAITSGDTEFDKGNYKVAILSYEQAIKVMPDESYPKQRIEECNKKIAKLEQERKEEKDRKEAYRLALKSADKLFDEKKLEEAKLKYQEILEIKPNDEYASARIEKIDRLIEEKQLAAKQLAAKQDEFDAAISTADNAFRMREWESALENYRMALKILPDENYPKTQISKIEQTVKKEKRAEKERQATEDRYNDAVVKAEECLRNKNYASAKHFFEKAMQLKPEMPYPHEKITEIDNIIEENNKIEAENNRIESAYKRALKNGENALSEKNYELAKNAFSQANSLKPNEPYPKEKIRFIEGIMADIEKEKAKQKEKEEKYNKMIAEADNAFKAEDFDKARKIYDEASRMYKDKKYAREKIVEIDKLIEERKKAKELAKKKENAYALAIQRAEEALATNSYENAKTSYLEALKYKPDNQEIKTKIKELESTIARVEKEKEEKRKKDANFDRFISKAESLFVEKKYKQSIAEYEKAAQIYPENEMPTSKIEDIRKLLEDNEVQYNEAIKKGDQAFDKNNYSVAQHFYKRALDLRAEDYPKKKLEECKKMLLKEKEQAKQGEYNAAIEKGDKAMETKELSVAEFYYKQALAIKTDDYPKAKLKEIEQNRSMAKRKELEKEYKDAITKADQAFKTAEFNVAKFYYNKALELKPKEEYPKKQLSEIEVKRRKRGN